MQMSSRLMAAHWLICGHLGIMCQVENTRVRFREATLEVGFGRPAIRMGRGPENEIVVPEPLASRVHAKIEWRQDRVFLIDQSLNGTYLQMQGKPEVILRRDEIELKGTGVISLGKSTAVQEESCVRFAVLIDEVGRPRLLRGAKLTRTRPDWRTRQRASMG